MEPIETTETNVTLKAEGCQDLPATYSKGIYTTVWRLTPEEIAQLSKNRIMLLHLWGEKHPPIAFTFLKEEKDER